MIKETLKLFNAVVVESKEMKNHPEALLKKCIANGYFPDPAIDMDDETVGALDKLIGLNGEKANSTFHKSWKLIRDTDQKELFLQAAIHYFTTYGFERLGIYREGLVYIPAEVLRVPAIRDTIPLVYVRAMTASEIREEIVKLGTSGVALSADTLECIMKIVETMKYDSSLVDGIKNRELKAKLCDFYDIVPSEPVEFLRWVISRLTDTSLLIKNDELIRKIRESNGKFLDSMMKRAPANLASIFYRYKPLFLAMKKISRDKNFYNRLRKDAKTMHVPMPEDYMNSVTGKIKRGRLDFDEFDKRLGRASVFRKIRLAYALKYRLYDVEGREMVDPAHREKKKKRTEALEYVGNEILYRIRNGRAWATDFKWKKGLIEYAKAAYETVLLSIASDVAPVVAGRTFYIPKGIHYAMPATEKQFVGNLPSGSYVETSNDLITGIHWTNTKRRIDLDLSIVSASEKVGWDASFRSDTGKILFSGDMTDAPAPNGATELFYIRKGISEPGILMVNYFNHEEGDPVDCYFLVAHEKPAIFKRNYMVDINNIAVRTAMKVTAKQNIIGLVDYYDDKGRVYFTNTSIGNAITSSKANYVSKARKYLLRSLRNPIDLEEILTLAGATVTHRMPDGEYTDLSPETLNKTTILALMSPTP
ncbi:hypothetical protein KKF34_16020 [Myxococcota bacterium]|nr:hypothetical protein [Myxococcota bacterium]MBU1380206.1 hypothetical protein [Myxococcota bacterium]MBU1498384.1 hypothetical protein [Myxococcota bacterium]